LRTQNVWFFETPYCVWYLFKFKKLIGNFRQDGFLTSITTGNKKTGTVVFSKWTDSNEPDLSKLTFTSREADVAGEGVADGVHGDGGPGVPAPLPTTANFHSGLSLIT
jgi:hypothetical protein